MFFGPIGKTRWPPWPLIGWDIFDFSSETAEWNSTKLDRKQDLNILYQVCVFRADRKNKMAALASDWLRHFRLLWNCWMEFNETWQKARSQRPLPSLCFSGQSEKQDGRCGLWLAKTFSTSPLKPLIWIQQNLTGSKISTSSTKFVFFGPIGKTRWLPFPIRLKGGILYSGARYVALSASCYLIRPGVDPRQGKKDLKRASNTKGFTWNAAILVVFSARYSKGWIQDGAKIGRGRASPLTKSSFRQNVHSNILMYCQQHMHLFESCDSGCLFISQGRNLYKLSQKCNL